MQIYSYNMSMSGTNPTKMQVHILKECILSALVQCYLIKQFFALWVKISFEDWGIFSFRQWHIYTVIFTVCCREWGPPSLQQALSVHRRFAKPHFRQVG
jgi:hypothetical protein